MLLGRQTDVQTTYMGHRLRRSLFNDFSDSVFISQTANSRLFTLILPVNKKSFIQNNVQRYNKEQSYFFRLSRTVVDVHNVRTFCSLVHRQYFYVQ